MKLKKLIVCLFLIISLVGCIERTYDYNLDYSKRETPLYPKVGETINITLPVATGCEWRNSVYDNKILLFKEQYETKHIHNQSIYKTQSFIFSCIQTGPTIINLEEIRKDTNKQVDTFSMFVQVGE